MSLIVVRAGGAVGADITEDAVVGGPALTGNEIRDDLPNTVFSDSTPVAVSNTSRTQWALLHFDSLAAINTFSELWITIGNEIFFTSTGSPHSATVSSTVKVWLMTNDWTPATVTWNTRPTRAGLEFTNQQTITSLILDVTGSAGFPVIATTPLPFGPTYYGLLAEISATSPAPDATNDLVYEGSVGAEVMG